MSRILLLFVLITSFTRLYARPEVPYRTSGPENPVSIRVSGNVTANCDSMHVGIVVSIALPASQRSSAVVNFDDGLGDVLLDSTRLKDSLVFNRTYLSTGNKHITFRLLKTNGQYEEQAIDYYLSEHRSTMKLEADTFYMGSFYRMKAEAGSGATYLWSNGATTAYLDINNYGTYWVKATQACGRILTDTVVVMPLAPGSVYLFFTTIVGCDSATISIWAKNPSLKDSLSYKWEIDGFEPKYGPAITVKVAGSAANICKLTAKSTTTDKVWIYYGALSAPVGAITTSASKVPLKQDSVILKGVMEIGAGSNDAPDPAEPLKYKWSTGDTTATLEVRQLGKYTVETVYARCAGKFKTTHSYEVKNGVLHPLVTADSTGFTFRFRDTVTTSFYDVLYWSFGDEVTTSGRDVSHTYTRPGLYNVKLFGYTGYPFSVDSTSFYVGVAQEDLTANLGPDTTLCPGQSIYLKSNNNTQAGSEYRWSTGDTTYTLQVTQPGLYWLQITNGNNISRDTIQVVAGCVFKPGFYYERAINGQLTMNFTETATQGIIKKRNWDFGDGTTSDSKDPSHTYAAPGDYRVRLWAEDSLTHREDSAVQLVRIIPPIQVDLGNDTTVAPGVSITLDGAKAVGFWDHDVTYLWSTGDTSRIITVSNPGSYWLRVNMYNYISTDTIVISNSGLPIPKAYFTYSLRDIKLEGFFLATPIADVGPVNYSWSFGDNTSDTGRRVIHSFPDNGTYRVTLTVSDSLHRADTLTKEITFKDGFVIKLGPDTTFYGNPIALRINAPYYGDTSVHCIWTPGGATSQHLVVTAPGWYAVTGTYLGYYVSTDSIYVRDGRPQQPADFNYNRADNGQLTMNYTAVPKTGAGNVTYIWNFGDYTTATGTTVSHTYSQAGTYDVRMWVKDSLWVTDSVRRQVEVMPFVSVNLGPDTIIPAGQSLRLDAIAAIGGIWHHDITYRWSTGDTSRAITVSQPGTYTLAVSMYGRTVRDSIRVSLRDTTIVAPPVVDSNHAVVKVADSIPVNYTIPVTLYPDNILTLQLIQQDSLTNGRVGEPEIIAIKSYPSANSRVSVNVVLPDSIPCGKNYRIRVVSSAPVFESPWSSAFEVSNPPATPVIAQRGDSLEASTAYAYQWYRNGQSVAGATTKAIRAKVNGAYQVEAIGAGGCTTMSAPVSMVITALTDVGLTVSQLNIFPNPSGGAIYLKLEKVPAQPLLIQVYNSRGVLVHTEIMKDKQIALDLRAQPKGMYYILNKGANKAKAIPVVIQ
jgi:PKD repeat protein